MPLFIRSSFMQAGGVSPFDEKRKKLLMFIAGLAFVQLFNATLVWLDAFDWRFAVLIIAVCFLLQGGAGILLWLNRKRARKPTAQTGTASLP